MRNNNSKAEKIKNFDPNGVGLQNGHFIGLPFNESEASIVLFPVPWDVTVSYGAGTATGPSNILEASPQLDLLDPDVPDAWKAGLYMRTPDPSWLERSQQIRPIAA
ncbi:MAG: arginase family protein, partial [Phaeodactylibacter sp.]|nr:arginase family protein [Phaeodactylibacter sp.]